MLFNVIHKVINYIAKILANAEAMDELKQLQYLLNQRKYCVHPINNDCRSDKSFDIFFNNLKTNVDKCLAQTLYFNCKKKKKTFSYCVDSCGFRCQTKLYFYRPPNSEHCHVQYNLYSSLMKHLAFVRI